MADFLGTPATDAGGLDEQSYLGNFDMSVAESFAHSPAKHPNALLKNLNGQRPSNSFPFRTPHGRSALGGIANPPGIAKPEFTPLLKSATKNHQRSRLSGGKENILHNSDAALTTPAALRNSYRGTGDTPPLPQVSASFYDEGTNSSAGLDDNAPTPVPAMISSSSAVSTPAARGASGTDPLRDGNALTLREQEQKLIQIDKDNFGLKLKIHFLEENLRRMGSEAQQTTMQENTELKVEKYSLMRELKMMRKNLQTAERELEEYRRQLQEYAAKVTRKHADEAVKQELERLRALSEEQAKELGELRESLEGALTQEDADRLRDDIEDLRAEVREKERLLDEKEEQMEALQDKADAVEQDNEEVAKLKDDVSDLEAEVRAKQNELDARIEELDDLKEEMDKLQRHDKSAQKLRGDFGELEVHMREKDQEIDEQRDRIRELEKQQQSSEAAREAAVHDYEELEREMEQKDGEILALQERLQTARDSWDNEGNQVESRLHQRDLELSEKDSELRERSRQLEDLQDELDSVRNRLEKAESSLDADGRGRSKLVQEHDDKIAEIQNEVRAERDGFESALRSKSTKIQEQADEIQRLSQRLQDAESGQGADEQKHSQQLQDLENALKEKTSLVESQDDQIYSLQAKLRLTDSPNSDLQKKARLVEEQGELLRGLQAELQEARSNAEDSKETAIRQMKEVFEEERQGLEDEIYVLEVNLDQMNTEQQKAETKIIQLEKDLKAAALAKDRMTSTEQTEAIRQQLDQVRHRENQLQQQVSHLEDELKGATEKLLDGTPVRERNRMRGELRQANIRIQELETQVDNLEHAQESGRQAQTNVEERKDLHEKVKQAKLEAEDLRLQLDQRSYQISHHERTEKKLESTVSAMRAEMNELQSDIAERDEKISSCLAKEKELRSQIREARKNQGTVDAIPGNSAIHQKRESDLRRQLKDARREIEQLQARAEQEDAEVQRSFIEAGNIRSQLRKQVKASDDDTFLMKEKQMRSHLKEVEREADHLQRQIAEREKQLSRALKKEEQLQSRLKNLRSSTHEDSPVQDGDMQMVLAKKDRVHAAEINGLAKQIQWLRAKCSREEAFRADLIYTKRYFLMQVGMYSACNKADLRLLSDIGVIPNLTPNLSRPSFRAVGQMVLATVRMTRMQKQWAQKAKLHKSLVKKVEQMKRQSTKAIAR